MKKPLIGLLTALTILSAGTTCAFAAGSRAGKNFIDTYNNGICDNYESRPNFTDNDNDGVCDNYGSGQGANVINGLRGNHGRQQGKLQCGANKR
jgi:hypothetical protein